MLPISYTAKNYFSISLGKQDPNSSVITTI